MFQSLFGVRSAIKISQLDVHELNERLANGEDILLVDVRSPGEYEYDGHIAGSRLLPLPSLMQRMNELPKDRPVVCVCRSGARSQTACEQLTRLGYANVSNLRGGMIDWKRAGLSYQ